MVSRILLRPLIELPATAVFTMASVCVWLYSKIITAYLKLLFIFAVVLLILSGGNYIYPNVQEKDVLYTEKMIGGQIYQSFLPRLEFARSSSALLPGIYIKNTTEFRLPRICSKTNASIWKVCDAARCVPYSRKPTWTYPNTTISGEKTEDFIDRVLRIAWGSKPPSIDLYLRAGCNGTMEMQYLFKSIELFWPRFLGSIVLVLDVGNEAVLERILPSKPTHHYVIAFEHPPCLPGRVFNQYSYLNLDRHCTADYVVTIDSDCVFHLPVTPDLIFRHGKVILTSSRSFQSGTWGATVNEILGEGMYDGHYMVTQPVTFAQSTFSKFRKWFFDSKGICYEDRIATMSPKFYSEFCWMCQLGTYLERGDPVRSDFERYWYHLLDDPALDPVIRYSIHVTYEPQGAVNCFDFTCFEKNANDVITQGLCRAFGSSVFHFCGNFSDFSYVNEVTFLYGHINIQAASVTKREKVIRNHLNRLSNITSIVLNTDKSLRPQK